MCWSVSPDGKSLLLSGHWNAQATQSKGKIPFDDGVLLRIDAETGRGQPLLRIDVVTRRQAAIAATPTAGPVGTLRSTAAPANLPTIAPPQ